MNIIQNIFRLGPYNIVDENNKSESKKYLGIFNCKDPYEFYNMGDYSYIIMDKKKFIFYEENSNLNDDWKVKVLNQSKLQYLKVLKDIDNKNKKIKVNFPGLLNFIIIDTSINYYLIELNINISDDVDWALCIKSILILLKYYIKVLVYKENKKLKNIIPQNWIKNSLKHFYNRLF